jgi:hypothetical protein
MGYSEIMGIHFGNKIWGDIQLVVDSGREPVQDRSASSFFLRVFNLYGTGRLG